MTAPRFRRQPQPFDLYDIQLNGATEKELLAVSQVMGLGLNLAEMKACQAYSRRRGREPTDVELQSIGQTWSEHCFHKTFRGEVVDQNGRLIARNLLRSYIAAVTRELSPAWCLSVFEDNAGIVDFGDGYAVAAKVETHNHPSAIEPFGGAATGVGGVIRDILGVWGEPIANTDVLCFGPLNFDHRKLPVGVKHPSYLFRGVVAGIGSYGNNMGIPTVNGAIYFHEGYVGSVVVYCGCIGILPAHAYVKDVKPGDVAVLVGGRTGRDGIHGVTFASADLTEKSEEVSRPAVQIPNPVEEEKVARALMKVRDLKIASSVTDLGGGGLSSAVGETAHRAGLGVEVQLDEVPLKYGGMAPWEIWISESQERMLLAAREKNLPDVLAVFSEEDVEATPIGRFVEDQSLKVMFHDVTVADLELGFLFNPPRAVRVADWTPPPMQEPALDGPEDLKEALLHMLSMPNICSREAVVRTYDHEVRGNTAVKPLQGAHSGPNDAAVLKPLEGSWRGLVISCGMNPFYGAIDPYRMAASAIDEALRNNVAVGGRRVALLDNFTWGNPEKPDRMGTLLRALEACYATAKAFEAPFISGKDSLYNESPAGSVTPTLLITAVGIIPDIRAATTLELKKPGNPVYLLGETSRELGGSQYYVMRGASGGAVPAVEAERARRLMAAVTSGIDSGWVVACHDLSEGGLGVALSEMALSGPYGVELRLQDVPRSMVERADLILFSESNSRFLVEVEESARDRFMALLRGLPVARVGTVLRERILRVHGLDCSTDIEASLDELREAWSGQLGA